ncbi:MAG: Wzz/FepE/Etk N-terminal domain-containing protein, partial [Candidatus Binatia bacterium]
MNEFYPHMSQRSLVPSGNGNEIVTGPLIELGEEKEGLDLRDFWRVIKKHRRLISLFFLGVTLTTVVVLLTMSPLYTANSTILIERSDPNVVDIKQVLVEPLGPDEDEYYKTQYEILKSRSLAAEVIQKEGLEKNALFTG